MIFHRRVKRKNATARVTSSFINLCVKTTFKGYSKLLGEQTSKNHQSYRSSPLASKETRLFRSLSISHKKMRDYSQSSNKQFVPMFWKSIYLPDLLSSVHPPIYPLTYSSLHPSISPSSYLVRFEVGANYFLVSFYTVRAPSKFLPSPSSGQLSLPFSLAGISWDKSYDVTIFN